MEENLRCPVCGAWLEEDDVLYAREDGTVAGCMSCIHEEYGWQRAGHGSREDAEHGD